MQLKSGAIAFLVAVLVILVAFSFGLGYVLRDRTVSEQRVEATVTPSAAAASGTPSPDRRTVEKAVSKIRGQRGTDVKLKVQHQGGETAELTVTRGEIRFDTVGGCPDAQSSENTVSSQITIDCPFKDRNGNPVKDLAYV